MICCSFIYLFFFQIKLRPSEFQDDPEDPESTALATATATGLNVPIPNVTAQPHAVQTATAVLVPPTPPPTETSHGELPGERMNGKTYVDMSPSMHDPSTNPPALTCFFFFFFFVISFQTKWSTFSMLVLIKSNWDRHKMNK